MPDQKAKVLLVEDDQFLASLLRNRLLREQFEVVSAEDGAKALEVLKTTKPDLMLLDIILPGKSGFEVLEELRADPRFQGKNAFPVIIISNLGQESDLDRSRELGAVDYFVKARSSIDEIAKRVKEVIHTPS